MSDVAWLVELEFERVQTYLFDVPELRAMIGANARLGETIRGKLSDQGFGDGESMAALAVRHGSGAALPADVNRDAFPSGGVDGDPLGDEDDPRRAAGLGVLARDGGHFHAVFGAEENAREFVATARVLAARRLSGLILDARIVPLTKTRGVWTRPERPDAPPVVATGEDLLDLPQFQVCQVVGRGPAGVEDGRDAGRWIGASVAERREAGKAFDQGKTVDVLGLLRGPMLDKLGLQTNQDQVLPTEFRDLSRISGQIAVIAADGNGVGQRSKAWRDGATSPDFFAREARGEQFFHAMRGAARAAFLDAVKATFSDLPKISAKHPLPFRPLMLGGDDLLLICDAAFGLRFVVEYVKALSRRNLADGKPLEIGAGVAIVGATFPFHHAHALAEQLAASAKRRHREEGSGSFVDWLAVSESWHEDVRQTRARDAVRRQVVNGRTETLILSEKPYRADASLKDLLDGAEKAVDKLARSQIIEFARSLDRGKRRADFALRNLPDRAREALAPALGDGGDTVWRGLGDEVYVTRAADFLELFELERSRLAGLGGAKTPEAAHA